MSGRRVGDGVSLACAWTVQRAIISVTDDMALVLAIRFAPCAGVKTQGEKEDAAAGRLQVRIKDAMADLGAGVMIPPFEPCSANLSDAP